MPVEVCVGDMFASGAQTLVNTVNCVGVMGKGIALEFKKRFPEMYKDYVGRCQRGQIRLGEPYLYRTLIPPWVLNFPTKDHWRSVSRLTDITNGLGYLQDHYREWGITSLALPPLGCGHGQLEWRVVGPTLYRHLSRFEIPVELFAPRGALREELKPEFLGADVAFAPATQARDEDVRIPAAWVALASVVAKIEREPCHWPIGRVTFQKIAYFATIQGLPTELTYSRGSFGPFSHDIKPMISKLVNNGLLREEKVGRMFAVRTGPTLRDALRRYRSEIEAWGPILARVTDLFLRLSTDDAEIAAT
ncbi:MAG: macro domain-containing protein, partial [Planctomycetia bacterium]|nr:macro domain-containing protein [Planctomycetia bacterium]